MKSYHGDPAIKARYLERVRLHRAADLLAKGATGKPSRGEKGCAVACTMDGYDHGAYGREIGVPIVLAHLEDAIFENLPLGEALAWPEAFLEAIPVGVDLFPAAHRITSRILLEVSLPCGAKDCRPAEAWPRIEASIRAVSDLHLAASRGEVVSLLRVYQEAFDAEYGKSAADSAAESAARSAAWSAARSAAESAARSAAGSAAWSAAWSAADSAARSAADSAAWSAAESAAGSAAGSAARSAAWSAAWRQIRDITIQELRGAT